MARARLAGACLAAVGAALPLMAAEQQGWVANPDVVERVARQRTTTNYDESRVPPYVLPDPLVTAGGTPVRYADGWPTRRSEVLEAFRAHVYGRSPGRPDRLSFKVIEEAPAMSGAATPEDPRFALVVSNESGESGAALARRQYGETIAEITRAFPHWSKAVYPSYDGRESALPVDQHLLLSLIAPRALYVASADEDLWSDPRGEFLSLAASSPVFALLGDPVIRDDQMPPLETPLIVGRRGYHVRRGGHNRTPYDWNRFADFADRLRRQPAAAR